MKATAGNVFAAAVQHNKLACIKHHQLMMISKSLSPYARKKKSQIHENKWEAIREHFFRCCSSQKAKGYICIKSALDQKRESRKWHCGSHTRIFRQEKNHHRQENVRRFFCRRSHSHPKKNKKKRDNTKNYEGFLSSTLFHY